MYGAFIFWPNLTFASDSDSVYCLAFMDEYVTAMPCVASTCPALAVTGIVITIAIPVEACIIALYSLYRERSSRRLNPATTQATNIAVTSV